MRTKFTYLCIAILSSAPAFGQDFTNNPFDTIEQATELAQRATEDPLILEGLSSILRRYNQARVQLVPAGYEDQEWLVNGFRRVSQEIDRGVADISIVKPLPDEEIAEMLAAFSENGSSFESFYILAQLEFGFADISTEQMLVYLSAYATLANSNDSELWERLSSLTGVWPLCFWQE